MVNNPNAFSQQGTGNTLNQIVDGADFPHTGLIKSLSQGIQGNYVISGFDITMGDNTSGTVADGVIMFEGQRKAITLGGSNSFTLTTSTGVNLYHLLVITNTGTLALRNQQAGSTITADKVADVTSGDTIIAVVSSQNGGSSAAQIQYLTTDKKSNSLSIARENSSNEYTEGLTIQSNAGDIEIEAKESDKDIIFKVNDATEGSVVDRLTLYGDNDPSFPNTEVKIEGGLLVTEDLTMNKIALGYANSPANGVAEISAYANSEPMIFKTGSSVERLRIEAGGNVGIGTASPSTKVEIQGAATDDVALTITNAQDANDNETATLRLKSTRGTDSDFEIVHDVFGNTEFFSNQPDTDSNKFITLQDAPKIVFNPDAIDMDIQFAGDNVNNLLYIDAGNDRVGIGTNTPSANLEVATGGTFRSPRLPTVSVIGLTTLTEATHAGAYLNCGGNVTLPATSSLGEHYTILNTTNGNITVSPSVSTNINGGSNGAAITVATYNAVTCIAIGSNNWIALGV